MQNSESRMPKAVEAQLENIYSIHSFKGGETPTFKTAYNWYNSRIFGWDPQLICQTMSKIGSREIVDISVNTLLEQAEGIRQDGFLPNMQYLDNHKGLRITRLEQITFPDQRFSEYDQPPFLGVAILETAKGLERMGDPEAAKEFLAKIYRPAKANGLYYRDHQRLSPENPLVFEKSPHGTGRDSDPSLMNPKIPRVAKLFGKNVLKPVLPIIDPVDTVIDRLWAWGKNIQSMRAGWTLEATKQIYGLQDVMKNCVVATNALAMAEVSRKMASVFPEDEDQFLNDAREFEEFAERLEVTIQQKMYFEGEIWSPETRSKPGAFYSLDKDGQPKKEMSVGNLMSVTLPNLTAKQLEANIHLIMTSFNTKFGLPSIPKDSRYYDPHYRRKLLWDGEMWPHMNVLVAEALRMQAARPEESFADNPDQRDLEQLQYLSEMVADLLMDIAKQSTEEVYPEMVDAEDGSPKRYPHVRNFGMAMQADRLPYENRLAKEHLSLKLGREVTIIPIDNRNYPESETA